MNYKKTLLFWACIISATPAINVQADSRFYLTVERSFSDQEEPKLRIDYNERETPLLLRILRPKKVEEFLEGQMFVSRSYEEPVTAPNLLRVMADGINKATGPINRLRQALNPDFRSALQEELSPPLLPFSSEPVSPPVAFRYGAPKGFEVVEESYLDLSFGGVRGNDSWWWFYDNSFSTANEGSDYSVKSIALRPLPASLYLVQAVQGQYEAQALLQVSSVSMQVLQSTHSLLLRVMKRDGTPVPGVSVKVRPQQGEWQSLPGTTSAQGELFIEQEKPLSGKLLVQGITPSGESVFASTDFLPSEVAVPDTFIFTDRPIIKPGEEVFLGGIVRKREKGQLTVPTVSSEKGTVQLISAVGAPLPEHSITVTSEGSFSGKLPLSSDVIPGLYKVLATVDNQKYQGEVRIQDYIKPTFFLRLEEKPTVIVPGDTVSLTIKAERFRGGAPQGVKYEAFLYRKKFEAAQFALQAGGGLTTGSDYFGGAQNAAALSQPERLYSSVEERMKQDETGAVSLNPWASAAELDENGTGVISFTVPEKKGQEDEEWIYTIVIRAQDKEGTSATLSESVPMTKSLGYASVAFPYAIAPQGASQVPLNVAVTNAQGTRLRNAKGVVRCTRESLDGIESPLVELPFTTSEGGTAELTVPLGDKGKGRVRAYAKVVSVGEAENKSPVESDAVTLLVLGEGEEKIVTNQAIDLVQGPSIIPPGSKVSLVALLPESALIGRKKFGWVTVAGEKIFAHTPHALEGASIPFEVEAKPEYGTGMYVSFAVPTKGGRFEEKTVSYRIVPAEKILTVEVISPSAKVPPLAPATLKLRVRSHASEPVPNAELFVSVVDEAVYAVQPEFRPTMPAFFFPLQRLNVSAFFSDLLQGYGNAQEFFRPNYRLHGLKTQATLPSRLMKDTAGFFPHVKTDAQGEALITVDMPANLTTWRVTALASDREGRVGEGKGAFLTLSDLGVEGRFPEYLRQGDSVEGKVIVSNRKGSPLTLSGNIVVQSGVQSPIASINDEVLLPDGTFASDITLHAEGERGEGIITADIMSKEEATIGGAREFGIQLLPRKRTVSYADTLPSGKRELSLKGKGTLESLQVRVYPGLFHAARRAGEYLATYPYGCTEQVVHSTIPNAALVSILKASNESSPLLKTAEQHIKNGVKKLLTHQSSSGGFGLYPGDTPTWGLTMMVVNAAEIFSSVCGDIDEGKLCDTISSMEFNAIEWLKLHAHERPSSEGMWGQFDAEVEALVRSGGIVEGNVSRMREIVATALSQNPTTIQDGMRVVAASHIARIMKERSWQMLAKEFEQQGTNAALQEKLTDVLQKVRDNSFASPSSQDQGYVAFEYPQVGFLSGLLAELYGWELLSSEDEGMLVDKLLTEYEEGYGWGSTFESAEVILRLQEYFKGIAEEEKKCSERKLLKGGEVVTSCRCETGMTICEVPSSSFSKVEGGALTVSKVSQDEHLSYLMRRTVPYDEVASQGTGLSLTQEIFKLLPDKTLTPVNEGTPLTIGDILLAKTSFRDERKRPRRGIMSTLFVVESPAPSVVQQIDESRPYLADAGVVTDELYWQQVKEVRNYPDKTVTVFQATDTSTPPSSWSVWRVAYKGTAIVPPASVIDMYNHDREAIGVSPVRELVVR